MPNSRIKESFLNLQRHQIMVDNRKGKQNRAKNFIIVNEIFYVITRENRFLCVFSFFKMIHTYNCEPTTLRAKYCILNSLQILRIIYSLLLKQNVVFICIPSIKDKRFVSVALSSHTNTYIYQYANEGRVSNNRRKTIFLVAGILGAKKK